MVPAFHLLRWVLFGLANRQCVSRSVYFRLNPISFANHFGTGFNVQHFALNCVDAIHGQTQVGLPLPGLPSKCFAKQHELNIRKYSKWLGDWTRGEEDKELRPREHIVLGLSKGGAILPGSGI